MEKDHLKPEELEAVRRGDYWKKFKHTEVLIRSIYDKSYPERSPEHQGFYKTEVYNWYHNGLEVRTGSYVRTGKIKTPKPGKSIHSDNPDDFVVQETEVEEFGRIPFENIIEIDMEGDEYNRMPHLYCDFPCGSDPYESIGYKYRDGYPINRDMIFDIT